MARRRLEALSRSRSRLAATSRNSLSTERSDWWGGHRDGGEWSCFTNPDEKCRSGPMLCLGDADNFGCTQFRFGHDSLALDTGDRYVRATHLPTEAST